MEKQLFSRHGVLQKSEVLAFRSMVNCCCRSIQMVVKDDCICPFRKTLCNLGRSARADVQIVMSQAEGGVIKNV